MRKRMVAGATVLAFLVVVGTAEASSGPPVKVVGGRPQQFSPSSDGTYLVWTQVKKRSASVLVKRLGSSGARQLNERGTQGYSGTFMPGTDHELIYQQIRGRRRSNLYLFDLSSGRRLGLPLKVNSRQWEWAPAASSRYIVFMRDVLSRKGQLVARRLLLYNRVRGTLIPLISRVGRHESVQPSFAGLTYVAWTVCRATCNAYYLDVATRARKRVPLPRRRAQYAPFVDEATSEIYFVRSKLRPCGNGVTFMRAPLDAPGSATAVAALPRGYDTAWQISVAPNALTHNEDLYFERYDCRRRSSDIYALRGVG